MQQVHVHWHYQKILHFWIPHLDFSLYQIMEITLEFRFQVVSANNVSWRRLVHRQIHVIRMPNPLVVHVHLHFLIVYHNLAIPACELYAENPGEGGEAVACYEVVVVDNKMLVLRMGDYFDKRRY